MRRLFVVGAMTCVGLFAGGVCAQPASTAAEPAIRPAMTKMLQAANAHDTDAFMASMLHGPALVTVINGQVIHGWNALHAQQLKSWHHGKSSTRYRQNGAPGFMSLGPDIEVVTWPLASSRISRDGKTITKDFVVSYVWQRSPQGWQIVYGHESWGKPSN